MFQNGISRNIKYSSKPGFLKSSHIYGTQPITGYNMITSLQVHTYYCCYNLVVKKDVIMLITFIVCTT